MSEIQKVVLFLALRNLSSRGELLGTEEKDKIDKFEENAEGLE